VDKRTQNRIWTRRRLKEQGYGALYERMTGILVRHNPVRFESPATAKEEYGGPIGALIPRLDAISNVHQLRFWLCDEFKKFFRNLAPAEEACYEGIAAELWQELTDFQQQQARSSQ
jgi:hypothetical protein